LENHVADTMRAVDPSFTLITDADSAPVAHAIRKRAGNLIEMLSENKCLPWQIDDVAIDGVKAAELTPLETWRAWTAVPFFNSSGESVFRFEQAGDSAGYPVAVTEWNWNGWTGAAGRGPLDSLWAKGLRAAGFLHALLRAADRVPLAVQSVAMGSNWDITSIRIPSSGTAFFYPTGAVSAFYRQFCGERLVPLHRTGGRSYAQPYRLGAIQPAPLVQELDVLATGGEATLFVHLLHRAFEEEVEVAVELPKGFAPVGTLHLLATDEEPAAQSHSDITRQTASELTARDGEFRFRIPPASIACLQLNKQP
jgi:hypothetical protein